MNIKKRMTVPDTMKGILTLFVVIRHVLTCTIADNGGWLGNYIWAIQMPAFFFLAGYFGVKEVSSIKSLFIRVKKSFLTLAVPFFAWSIIVCTLIFGMNGRNVLLTLADLVNHVDHGLWFIWVLFIIRVYFDIANYIITKNKKFGVLIAAFTYLLFLVLLGAVGIFTSLGFIGIKFILYYSIFYGIGFCVKIFSSKLSSFYNKVRTILFPIAALVLAYIVINIDLYATEDNIFGISIRLVSALLAIFSLYETCSVFNKFFVNARLDVIGKYSLEVYTTHAMIIICLGLSNMEKAPTLLSDGGGIKFLQLLVTISCLTYVIILVIKGNKYLNRLFFGKGWD